MELIEFLKQNRGYFNIRNIEDGADIPNRTLNNVLNGNRKLSKDNAELLLNFFNKLFVDLDYEFVDKRYNRYPEKESRLPNLNKDGSFDMSHWEVIAVKMCHKTALHMVKYEKIDKGYYPRD